MKVKKSSVKPNKKGSAVFMVIVSLTIIAIFASTALLMSFGGYIAKHKDTRSDRNFYLLEERLDKIKTFIGIKANEIFTSEYQHMRNVLSNLQPTEVNPKWLEFCQSAFANCDEFNHLELHCDDAKDADGFKFSVKSVGLDPSNERCYLFKEVRLEFNSGTAQGLPPAGTVNTYNSITTDIVITIPTINLDDQIESEPKQEYIYISDDTITLKGTDHNAVGNIYCGNDLNLGESSASVSLRSNYLTVFNQLSVAGGSAKIYGTSKEAEIWARDIIIEKPASKASLTMIGNIFVADDLEINGKNSAVTLSGTYCGFGNKNKQNGDDDSAIAVNGKGTTLNLSSVDKLIIGGVAFFPLSYSDTSTVNPSYSRTGEALALLVNENLYQVYSGYVHINKDGDGKYQSGYVDKFDTAGAKIDFTTLKDSTNTSLDYYLKNGYTLVSSGVDITAGAPNGAGIAASTFWSNYLSATPIKLATYEKKGLKYCYLYYDFKSAAIREDYTSKCIDNGLANKFLTNFLDLGMVTIDPSSDIYSETNIYAYIPDSDSYKSVLIKENTTIEKLPDDIEKYIGNKSKQFAQYNKSLAPVSGIDDSTDPVPDINVSNEGPITPANQANKITKKYVDDNTIAVYFTKYSDKSVALIQSDDKSGNLMVVNGNLKIASGSVKINDVESSDAASALSAISQYGGMIVVKGNFESDSSVAGSFRGMIITKGTLTISGGTYSYNNKAVSAAITVSRNNSDWANLFTAEFYTEQTTGVVGETTFNINDFMAYRNYMKNKAVA